MSTDRAPDRSDAVDEPRAWVEIDGDAILRNLDTLRAALPPDTRLIPMVKADGYGLGVRRLVRLVDERDPWAWGVATVAEGLELRRLGQERPILVFSPVSPGEEVRAIRGRLTPCLSDVEALVRLRSAAEEVGVPVEAHLEVDTGMGRAGLRWDRVHEWASYLVEATSRDCEGDDSGRGAGVALTGIFTHFHSADEDQGRARETIDEQRDRFDRARSALAPVLAPDPVVHLANSAAALRDGAAGGTAVRPGIFLYGGHVGPDLPAPEPVVRVRARVIRVVNVPEGATLGYGATHQARAPERWATLAIGYGDGLPRRLSNRGCVGVHGCRAPIVGRISMDTSVVDITGLPSTRPGDVATIVGRPDDGAPSLDRIATEAETISYEILTGLSPRLPRRWLPQT